MLNRFSGTDAQVTRRRRHVSSHRRPLVAIGTTVVVLAAAGIAYASTQVFGQNQVGTEYANGIQVSDDQIIKPLGDRLLTKFGKFMGSTVSPDGRFLAATSADKSVALQIFDLSSYRLIWTVGTASGVNLRYTNLTVGQEGPTYSPVAAAGLTGSRDISTADQANGRQVQADRGSEPVSARRAGSSSRARRIRGLCFPTGV
jgi:hypothetical protein